MGKISKNNYQISILYIAWLQSVIATFGSLFFSEVMKFPPCVLCWYQRIAMYPLVFIIAVGLLRKDKRVYLYVLPLSITGFIIAIYHNLLYYNILPESIKPCVLGVSCTTKFIEWFGFITIPFLSLVAFLVINLCMIFYIIDIRKKRESA
jgi:disulfide bond formation protein DsbB